MRTSTFNPMACADDLKAARTAPGWWDRIRGAASKLAAEWSAQRQLRQAEDALHDLDDHLLRDIGIDRADIHRIVRAPETHAR